MLVLAAGLALHLTAGNSAADARWVIFHVDDAKTMAIDPDSIRRDGRQLTDRVGVAWTRERRSSVAVFTADCVTRERRLETVQHYSGTYAETATRCELRGTPAGAAGRTTPGASTAWLDGRDGAVQENAPVAPTQRLP